jgi:serine/threonine-protein kinase RsbW
MAADDETRVLVLPAELGRVAEVRAFVREAAITAGGSDEVVEDAIQAIDEAATNVIVHGYRGTPGELEVRSTVRNGRIEIRLLDRAPVFDPGTVPAPDLTVPPLQRRPGGMGVHLIRAGTDETRHHPRPGGGNELVLVCDVERRSQEGSAMSLSIEPVASGAGADVAVLALSGELDASNYETLIDAAAAAYAGGARSLVLDLGGLTFMASSGLVALYSTVRIFQGEALADLEEGWGAIKLMEDDTSEASRVVRLAAVQPAVDRVLERTGLKRLFSVDPSREVAVDAFAGA